MNFLRSLHRFSANRLSWLLLLLSAVALLASALWFQYVEKLEPCLLCIYIRVAVVGIGVAALVGLVQPKAIALRFVAIIGWITSAGLGLEEALLLIEKQSNSAPTGLFGATCDYVPNFPEWAQLHQWMPDLFQPRGQCSDAPWVGLGVTMAEWTAIAFALYLLIAIVVVLSQFAGRSPRSEES